MSSPPRQKFPLHLTYVLKLIIVIWQKVIKLIITRQTSLQHKQLVKLLMKLLFSVQIINQYNLKDCKKYISQAKFIFIFIS